MYQLAIDPEVDKTIKRLAEKDKVHYEELEKKIRHIVEDPLEFKPLRKPLNGFRRVHIGSFVLVYHVEDDTVFLNEYAHHDHAYGPLIS